jgi:hypothetical protein
MPALTQSLVSTSQPNFGGWTVVLTSENKLTSVNYILYTGNMAYGATANDFINGTVVLGAGLELISTSADAEPTYTYCLTVSNEGTLPSSDYYMITSANFVDAYGSNAQTPFQTNALPLPFSPTAITIPDDSCFIATAGGISTISVLFEKGTTVDCTYTLAIQYTTSNGYDWSFDTIEGNAYVNNLSGTKGGITVQLAYQVDEAVCAIQVVRSDVDVSVTSAISNTVIVTDQSTPSAPTSLIGTYDYSTLPQTVDLAWVAGAGSQITDVQYFTVYRGIAGATPEALSPNIPYVPGTSGYTYSDELTTQSAGTVILYYVVASNGTDDSSPSNTFTLSYIVPSSPPRDLVASALAAPAFASSSFEIDWRKPSNILYVPDAYFTVEIYGGSNDTLLHTAYVPYVTSQEQYSYNIHGLTYYTVNDVKVYLVTLDPNNVYETINGRAAEERVISTIAPIIDNVNNEGDNNTIYTRTEPLTQFTVYSYYSNVNVAVTAIEGTVVNNNKVILTASAPTYQSDPYDQYYGSYYWVYDVTYLPGEALVIDIFASNVSDVSTLPITGSFTD